MKREVWHAKRDSVSLLCRISRLQTILQSQPNASILWYKDDQVLQSKRATITPEGNLNITRVSGALTASPRRVSEDPTPAGTTQRRRLRTLRAGSAALQIVSSRPFRHDHNRGGETLHTWPVREGE